MESFNLNIIPGKDRPVCHASQYDIGRTIRVNLFEGFNVFTLDGTEVISISVRKPDGNVVTESVTNTSDSYVEFVTTEQMTACHGSNLCELKLEKGADVIGTMNFILEVEQDPLEGGVQSASEIDNLQTQVAGMVATEVANQYDSANVIFDAAPVPGHGNGYTVTSEGIATELALKQDATDANLQTTDMTIVGAINELLGDLGNKADAANTYTKTEVDNALALKQDTLTDSTATLTPSTGTTLTSVNCARYGKVVNLICGVSVTSPSSWQVLTTLPTGYRPPQQVYGAMCKSSSANGKLTAHINIEPNGNVRLANELPDAGATYNLCISFIVG